MRPARFSRLVFLSLVTLLSHLFAAPTFATPEATSLGLFKKVTIAGNYVAAGVGLRDKTSATINIAGIPQGATIVEAVLYWGMLSNGEAPALKHLKFNGVTLSGTLIGTGADTCWGLSNSFAYRATVTDRVSGNGSYRLSEVAHGSGILAQGASLVVVYEKAGDPFRNVIILDGNIVFDQSQETATTIIPSFVATTPTSAKTTFMVGDGQPVDIGGTETASFSTSQGSISWENPFEGSDGPLWDTDTYDVSSQVAAGSTSGSITVTIQGDCLMWIGQVFSVRTKPPTIAVRIDVKPGNASNSINPRNNGVIPVAILTTSQFDAKTVDPGSIVFGPGGATETHWKGHLEDVDGDGDLDLVLHFRTQDTGIVCGATSAVLQGKTLTGQAIRGSDSIRTVGCGKGG